MNDEKEVEYRVEIAVLRERCRQNEEELAGRAVALVIAGIILAMCIILLIYRK